MSASMMKPGTRQAASARPSAKRCVAPSALMTSAPRVAKAASPAHSPSCPCCSKKASARPSTVCAATATDVAIASKEYDLKWRSESVAQHFPTAITVDDFIARVETVLAGYGFTGENSIAMTNLCRDEVTVLLKDKIESAFGASFNTNGLGGVLTCGVTGMGAGLSHSPACVAGRERYVFFSFPHIGIDGAGNVGSISRPGRSGRSCACGALQKCLNEFRAEGYAPNCRVPGVHDPLDPEYSILKQRLARRLRYERQDVSQLTLASLTGVAERTITNDLEYLIEKSVDTNKADYAIITGVQIHNWATNLNGDAPSLEFVAPTKVMVCVDGQKIHLDLTKVPSLSPRQLALLAAANVEASDMPRSLGALQEVPYEYMAKRLGGGNSKPGGGASVTPVAATKSTIAPQYRAFQTTVEQPAYNISEENFSETFQAPSRVPAVVAAATVAVQEEVNHPSFDMSASQEEQVAALEKALVAGEATEDAKKNGKKNGLWPF